MRYLGSIVVPNGTSEDNSTTATPFDLPKTACALVFAPSATGLLLRYSKAADVTSNDFPLLTDTRSLPWAGRSAGLVGLKNPTGGSITCKVYATDYPGTPTLV
jgi:hypothetical protein